MYGITGGFKEAFESFILLFRSFAQNENWRYSRRASGTQKVPQYYGGPQYQARSQLHNEREFGGAQNDNEKLDAEKTTRRHVPRTPRHPFPFAFSTFLPHL